MIELQGVAKEYLGPGVGPARVLRGVSLSLPAGTFAAVLGKSGSGKSTLLNLVAGLDRPTAGEVTVAGTRLGGLGEDALARWRGRTVGVVFQFFQLLPAVSVLDNVLLAMDFVGVIARRERLPRARHLLELVGIPGHADKPPAKLSGGEQQRAAVARALANDPPVLVADEPTGNLDTATAAALIELLAGLSSRGKTLLVVTHDAEVARRAGHVVRLADGEVEGQP